MLSTMKKGTELEGFRAEAVYLNDAGAPMGGRFVHGRSGFVLDLLTIETAPQAFTWVRSFPVGDQGEPHTQEHLLLGKGTRGRSFAALETMWLTSGSAFTEQLRTCYHFNTVAGADVFFDMLTAQIDALLHPNYSDEEIRREVRNFGVDANADGSLRIEEKGTVYNEMVSSTRNPWWVVLRAAGQQVYGTNHPLSWNAGGEPSGIRTMKPEDIRRFHQANYHLGNMGTIIALPSSVGVREALSRIGAILDKAAPETDTRTPASEDRLPAAKPAAPGGIAILEYPDSNDRQPSPLVLSWGADRRLDNNETFLLELFVSAFAGDPTTNLYALFVNSATRKLDVGAKGVFGIVGREQGHAVQVALADVDAAQLTTARIGEVRQVVTDELARLAALPDGSDELKKFNERIASRLIQAERDAAKFINSPPGFGARGSGPEWMEHLRRLESRPEFRRSLTNAPEIAFVRGLLAKNENIWRTYLPKWKLAGVVPWAAAARPSSALLETEARQREERVSAELASLQKRYERTDPQEAIRRYKAASDAAGAEIEALARTIPPPEFVKTPPMTLDDPLRFQALTLAPGLPFVSSRFENMSAATLGLALRLDRVPPVRLRLLSLLPTLMTHVGVIEDGKPVSYEEMSERLRREILSLDAGFSTSARTGRTELVLMGGGLGQAEAERAVGWMSLVLQHPDWRVENLPRLRDVVDQALASLRNMMQGPEESWVQDPAIAYRLQDNPAFLAADSSLTAEHYALRLKWLLKSPPAESGPIAAFFEKLGAAGTASREDLKAFLAARSGGGGGEGAGGDGNGAAAAVGGTAAEAAPVPEALAPLLAAYRGLPEADRAIATDALEDLDASLVMIPDGSLATDWAALCAGMREDLLVPPQKALEDLHALRKDLLKAAGARMFFAGSSALETALRPRITALAASLEAPAAGGAAPSSAASASPATASGRLVDQRLKAREPKAVRPVFVGLLAPNMQGGVILTSAPGVHFADAANRDRQLDYLASRLFAGYGAHGIFLKTIGAGLAYSNGLRASVASGRMGYYAERTPELPQTVKFVIDTLKAEPRNTALAPYAVAQVFGESRAAGGYEDRAEAMAEDLADGQPPAQVRAFREAILKLASEATLGETLFDRKDKVLGRMLPGYNVKAAEVPGGIYFVIGPERQLDAWERYLKSAEGPETTLWRLFPRDYWQP